MTDSEQELYNEIQNLRTDIISALHSKNCKSAEKILLNSMKSSEKFLNIFLDKIVVK